MAAVAQGRIHHHLRGRRLLFAALLVLGVAFVAIALVMAWPNGERSDQAHFELSAPDDYAVGSVTNVPAGRFYLVRLTSDEFIALSWRGPDRGCTVPWRPTLVAEDANGTPARGWFRDPCSGSTFDRSGHLISGTASRDMDRFVVDVSRGRVIVERGTYVCGFAPPDTSCVPAAP